MSDIKQYKFQTPLHGLESVPEVLLYDKTRDDFHQLTGKHAREIIEGLGMAYTFDKCYCDGLIDKNGQLILNTDTLTREVQSW